MPLLWSWNVLELTATVLVTNRKGSDGRRTLKNQGKYPRPIDFYDSTPDLLSTLYFNVFGTRNRRFSTQSRYPFRLAHLEPHLHSFLRWHEAYLRRTWSISSAFLKQTYIILKWPAMIAIIVLDSIVFATPTSTRKHETYHLPLAPGGQWRSQSSR